MVMVQQQFIFVLLPFIFHIVIFAGLTQEIPAVAHLARRLFFSKTKQAPNTSNQYHLLPSCHSTEEFLQLFDTKLLYHLFLFVIPDKKELC
jgi:hypothetical protein